MAPTRQSKAIVAAMNGWWVANQVRPIAAASSVVLRAMLETGSGLGVTAVRSAVYDPWAASATTAPIEVARICICGVNWELAW